jgi:hypothetical protein
LSETRKASSEKLTHTFPLQIVALAKFIGVGVTDGKRGKRTLAKQVVSPSFETPTPFIASGNSYFWRTGAPKASDSRIVFAENIVSYMAALEHQPGHAAYVGKVGEYSGYGK